MKKFITFLILSVLTAPTILFASQKALICGSGWKNLAIVDLESQETIWQYTVPKYFEANSICMTKEKNIAFANKRCAVLINMDKEILWQYDVDMPDEVQSVYELENGNLLVGICANPSKIVELDKNGKLVKEVKFESKTEKIHGQLRLVIPSKNGNYLVTQYAGKALIEVDQDGKILANYPMPMPTFGVAYLDNGNLILSGDKGKIIELNPTTKQIVRTIDSTNIKGADLLFATQVNQLKNGNLLIGNWNGHSKDKTQPKLMQIDKDNNVVWKLTKDENIKNVSGVYVFE